MTYRVYLAAPFAARDGLRVFADELDRIGMTCTSSWLATTDDIATGIGAATEMSAEQVAEHARADLGCVDRSDCIVQFTGLAVEALGIPGACGPTLHTGGRHIELGYALAKKRRAIIVGPAENIFQRALCTVVANWHGAVLELVRLERADNAPRAVERAS